MIREHGVLKTYVEQPYIVLLCVIVDDMSDIELFFGNIESMQGKVL